MKNPKVNVSLKMPPELWDTFKTTCGDMGKSMSETIEDFCKIFVISRNMPQTQEILDTVRTEIKGDLKVLKTEMKFQDNIYMTRIREIESQLFSLRVELENFKKEKEKTKKVNS